MANIHQIYNLRRKIEKSFGKELADTIVSDQMVDGLEKVELRNQTGIDDRKCTAAAPLQASSPAHTVHPPV